MEHTPLAQAIVIINFLSLFVLFLTLLSSSSLIILSFLLLFLPFYHSTETSTKKNTSTKNLRIALLHSHVFWINTVSIAFPSVLIPTSPRKFIQKQSDALCMYWAKFVYRLLNHFFPEFGIVFMSVFVLFTLRSFYVLLLFPVCCS